MKKKLKSLLEKIEVIGDDRIYNLDSGLAKKLTFIGGKVDENGNSSCRGNQFCTNNKTCSGNIGCSGNSGCN
jgi:hypothetical protein